MKQEYEVLFTPWKIGNLEIKNRIVMCPMVEPQFLDGWSKAILKRRLQTFTGACKE